GAHQLRDLRLRPAPVIGGEGEQCEHADVALEGGFNCPANGVSPRTVALPTRQPAFHCPTPVAVHNDRDVQAAVDDSWMLTVAVTHCFHPGIEGAAPRFRHICAMYFATQS